jgi:hypothetical protein
MIQNEKELHSKSVKAPTKISNAEMYLTKSSAVDDKKCLS